MSENLSGIDSSTFAGGLGSMIDAVVSSQQARQKNAEQKEMYEKAMQFNAEQASIAQKKAYLTQKSLGLNPTADTISNAPVPQAPAQPDLAVPNLPDIGSNLVQGMSTDIQAHGLEQRAEELRLKKAEILRGCYTNDSNYLQDCKAMLGSKYDPNRPIWEQLLDNPEIASFASSKAKTNFDMTAWQAGFNFQQEELRQAQQKIDQSMQQFKDTLGNLKDFQKWQKGFEENKLAVQKEQFNKKFGLDLKKYLLDEKFIEQQITWGDKKIWLATDQWQKECIGNTAFAVTYSQFLHNEELKLKRGELDWKGDYLDQEWKLRLMHESIYGLGTIGNLIENFLPTKWLKSLGRNGSVPTSNSTPMGGSGIPSQPQPQSLEQSTNPYFGN